MIQFPFIGFTIASNSTHDQLIRNLFVCLKFGEGSENTWETVGEHQPELKRKLHPSLLKNFNIKLFGESVNKG